MQKKIYFICRTPKFDKVPETECASMKSQEVLQGSYTGIWAVFDISGLFGHYPADPTVKTLGALGISVGW